VIELFWQPESSRFDAAQQLLDHVMTTAADLSNHASTKIAVDCAALAGALSDKMKNQ
jgi:hypothetical protein